ncbi:MAG: glycoside hydrolase family 3 N-terminal domain-containing protein, partial [Eubacteriales bacterium]
MDSFEKQARELVSKMTLAERCSQLLHNAPAIERLGVPAYNWWNEALHGVARSGVATVFPQSIAMAASFDDALLYRVAQAISDEARAKYNEYKRFGSTQIYQGLTFWSPNINIFRDPRWGRGHETYGEDPYLTGRMGAAFVRGLQGDPKAKYKKVDATLKHYAVHSGPESQRHSFNAVVSKQDLYETYLPAFKYCIEKASPSAVMGAYNRTNGEPCCASPTLIGEILYKQFKFKGYYLSDCGAINDIHANHHVTSTQAESAALAINNGCVLNCGSAYGALMAAYEAGLVSEETITEAAVKLFTARFRLGMFAPEGDCEYDKIPYDVVDCKKHRKLNAK